MYQLVERSSTLGAVIAVVWKCHNHFQEVNQISWLQIKYPMCRCASSLVPIYYVTRCSAKATQILHI